MRESGKTDEVIDLLRHLPYLEDTTHARKDRVLVQEDTTSIAYHLGKRTKMEETNPLPGHCVYLTEGLGREGYSLIVNTKKGKADMTSWIMNQRLLTSGRHYNHVQHYGSSAPARR